MPGEPLGARRPRPVADVPPAALADGQLAAKRWLLALVGARPLATVAELPTATLARDAPVLCAAILRAVGGDSDLERLETGDLAALAAQAGSMAGAGEPAAIAGAVAALRDALWDALAAEAPPEDAGHATALARRLEHVCDVVTARALGGKAAPRDEPAVFRPAEAPRLAAVPGGERTIQEAIAGRDGLPFALLAVEVDEAERLLAADGNGSFAAALARVEGSVRNELRPADALVREAAGRWWLLASELGEGGGRALGERVADAVAAAGDLGVSIGVAAAPTDGSDAETLMGRAERGLFASRAAGVPLA